MDNKVLCLTQNCLLLLAASTAHLVLGFNCLPLGLVLGTVLLSFLDHPVYLITVECAGTSDLDVLLLLSAPCLWL